MSLQTKYQGFLNLVSQLGGTITSVAEEGGVLKVAATVPTPFAKNEVWDKIKELGGSAPNDLVADIRPATEAYYHKYTVVKGDTLGKIAKEFYGEAKKYTQIFDANRNILSDADEIEVGQELVIPHEQ